MVGRKGVLALVVAALMITAGCAGSTGDGTDDDPSPTPTVADSAPDAGPGDDPDDGTEDGDVPDEGDEWAFSEAERALRNAGSFTSTWTWRASNGTETASTVVHHVVDLVNERSLRETRNADDDGEFVMDDFYTDGVTYMRMVSGGPDSQPMYMASEGRFEGSAMIYEHGYSYDPSHANDWSFERETTHDGVSVREYVYTGSDLWDEIGFLLGDDQSEEAEVTGVEFRMLVDSDGIARYQRFRVEGLEEGTSVWFEWEYEITDIGSTTVEDPAWLPDALEQTGRN
jgi:hypothetical protein